MEEILKQPLEGQNKLIERMDKLEDGQVQILKRMDNLEEDMATKVQQDEKTQIIKAILHNTETFNAEINALKLPTLSKEALTHLATKDSITKVETKIDLLNNTLFQIETEIALFKLVK